MLLSMTYSVWVLLALMAGHALSYARRTVLRRRQRAQHARERAAAAALAAAGAGGPAEEVLDLNESQSSGMLNVSVHSMFRTAGA